MYQENFFADNLKSFFEKGRRNKCSLQELTNIKNELMAIHKNILFNSDIENAKYQRQVHKIQLNQVSLKTDQKEAEMTYNILLKQHEEKLNYMIEKYQERVDELNAQIIEKNKSLMERIKEEDIKKEALDEDVKKLRKKEQKYYAKAADSEIYQRCLDLQKENTELTNEIQKIKEEVEKKNKSQKPAQK